MACLPIGAGVQTAGCLDTLDLPAVARAATTVHKGPMSHVEEGYQALAGWAEETGERLDGFSRELYLDCDGQPETWVTELQFPLADTEDKRGGH